MLDTMMKVSLTLVAFDKMSRVIRDAVNKSNDEFDKLQREIKNTSDMLDKLGQNMTKVGGALTLAGADLHINWESQRLFLKHSKWNTV